MEILRPDFSVDDDDEAKTTNSWPLVSLDRVCRAGAWHTRKPCAAVLRSHHYRFEASAANHPCRSTRHRAPTGLGSGGVRAAGSLARPSHRRLGRLVQELLHHLPTTTRARAA